MHFPINFQIGLLTINAHFVFELLAYTIGFRYYLFLRITSKDFLTFDQRIWIIIAAAAGALIASRTLGFLSFQSLEHKSFIQNVIIWMSSKSILGGLLGGVLAVEIAKWKMGIKTSTGDLLLYPIILGMMIGRIGCFSQGILDGTHGIPSTLPWALDMGDGILRHPTQLYEILFLGLIWIFLKRFEHKFVEGGRFKIFIISYLMFRFFVEWLKPVYFHDFGLSAIQITSLVGLVYYMREITNPRRLFKQ